MKNALLVVVLIVTGHSARGLSAGSELGAEIAGVKSQAVTDERIPAELRASEMSLQERKALIYGVASRPVPIDYYDGPDSVPVELGVGKDRENRGGTGNGLKSASDSRVGYLLNSLPNRGRSMNIDKGLENLALTESELDVDGPIQVIMILGERKTQGSAEALTVIYEYSPMIADRLVRKHNDTLEDRYGNWDDDRKAIQAYKLSNWEEMSPQSRAQFEAMFPEAADRNYYDERLTQIQDAIVYSAGLHGSTDLSLLLYHAAASDSEFIKNSAMQALENIGKP